MAKETAKRITSGSGVDPDKDTSDISDFEDRLDRELNALVPAKYRSSSSSSTTPVHVPESSSSSNALSRRDRSPSTRHKDDFNTDSDATLEILPDRFTPDGQPLDSRDPRDGKLHSRRGEFLYHDHHGNGLKQIAGTGQWGVSGTDAQAVDRIVRKVEGVLEGKGSWAGLVMGLLSGRLMEGSEVGVESSKPKRRSRRRLGMAKLGV